MITPTTPYLIVSDIHFHAWGAFSSVSAEGVNSRLQMTLDAMRAAAYKLREKGGNIIFNAGDVFHRRGQIEPAVLNPVLDLHRELIEDGFEIYALPGNHDMTFNDSSRTGNAVTALEAVGVKVAHEPLVVSLSDDYKVVMFPWYSKVETLLAAMGDMRDELTFDAREFDVEPVLDAIIHAPIDGVLPHLPSHDLSAAGLASVGFNRVFSGHYHNHADMGSQVWSIGALTNQTWGDIGSKAGFLIVDEENVAHFETDHPKFIELDGSETDEIAKLMCAGNYVRVKVEVSSDSELQEIRQGILDMGALGVQMIATKTTVVTRPGASASPGSVSLESSMKAWMDKRGGTANAMTLALDILGRARAA